MSDMSEANRIAANAPVNLQPKWANAPELKDLKQDLEDAKPMHDSHRSKVNSWLDNLNITGKAKPPAVKGRSQVQPALIRRQAEWRYAALSEPFLSTKELYKVKPVSWEDRKGAQQNQLVLNHQFNTKIDKVKFIDEYVRTAVDEGTVIVRTGWHFVEEKVKKTRPVVTYTLDPTFRPTIEHITQMREQSPSEFQTDVPEELKIALEESEKRGVPIRPTITGEQETYEEMVTVCNKPTAEVWDFNNVVLDPTAMGVVENANFCVFSFETNLATLKKEGKKYKNLDKILLTNASILSEPDHKASEGAESNFNFLDKPRQKFIVYEYWGNWDINGDGTVKPIVAAWAGSTLIRLDENPYPDKQLPLVVEHYLPVRKSNYGEPDGVLILDNQKILGAVTRGMIDIMGKSANAQIGMSKQFLDVSNRKKFDNGQDYEFNPGMDPRTNVHMHKFEAIPESAQFMVNLQNMEAESMTGVKSFSSGVSGASLGDVAAGVRGALDAASKRELGILRRLSSGIEKVGRKFIAMNAVFLDEEEVVRITNEEFVTVKRDDLPGNFDLELSISTAEEDNNKAEQLAFLLQTTGNTMDPELNKMILSDIARLRKMPDMAKRIEEYQPQPDPMQVKKAQLELALLEAQINKENAQAASFGANAQLHQAKAGTEGAKAAHVQAQADTANLDFVERESGTTQARDLEKIGEQARSQGQVKAMEHGFNAQEADKDRRVDLLKEYLKTKAKAKATK